MRRFFVELLVELVRCNFHLAAINNGTRDHLCLSMLSWRMNVNMLSKRIDLDGLEISGLKHRRSTLPAIPWPWPLDRPRHHYCEWNGDIASEKYGTTGAGDAPLLSGTES